MKWKLLIIGFCFIANFTFAQDIKKPNPFQPDIAVDITTVIDKKLAGLDAHQSQFYEWLPWIGNYEEEVPKDPAKHKAYLFIFKGKTGFSRSSDLGIAVNSIRDLYFVFNMIDSIETFTKRLSLVNTRVLFLALMVDNTVQPALGN